MRWSNCLIYALTESWRHGGYIVTMKSNRGWWPHFVHATDLKDPDTYTEFAPPQKFDRLVPPPLFRGSARPWSQHAHEAGL